MASKPVRLPEDTYEEIRDVAVKLNVPLSEATDLVLETGLQHFRLEDHLSLDPDLQQELSQALLEADSEDEIWDRDRKLRRQQVERNRERSDLTEPAQ